MPYSYQLQPISLHDAHQHRPSSQAQPAPQLPRASISPAATAAASRLGLGAAKARVAKRAAAMVMNFMLAVGWLGWGDGKVMVDDASEEVNDEMRD